MEEDDGDDDFNLMLKMTHVFHKNYKYSTFHNKSHHQPHCTSQLVYKVLACCSSDLIFTFLCAGRSIQNASEQFVSCVCLSFVNVTLHTTPQTKI
jgi:hypothetical protein